MAQGAGQALAREAQGRALRRIGLARRCGNRRSEVEGHSRQQDVESGTCFLL
ncbi:uncharacterized protein J3R85_001647 [Psidium guajava]|nr:uncharacterized protein J3R85_001647 [Psidium guajava]